MRVLLLILVLAVSSSAAEVDAIRIAYPSAGVGAKPHIPGSSLAPLYSKHLLEDEFKPDGISVEWSLLKGAGPAINELLAADRLDLVYLGDLAALLGRSVGIKTRLLLSGGRGGNLYLVVKANSPAQSLQDLRGKRIGLFKGTALQLQADRFVTSYGFGEADFKTVNFDPPSGLAAVINGDIDGLWSQFPVFEQVDSGALRVIASTRAAVPSGAEAPKAWGALLVREDFAAKHPALLQRIVNVIVRETAWSSDEAHRAELLDIWGESGFPASVFSRELEGFTLANRLSPLLDDGFLHEVHASADEALALKLVRHPIDVDSWADRSFLDRAISDLHLEAIWTKQPAAPKPSP
jgi:sulfonate transport system substrate-binding protein